MTAVSEHPAPPPVVHSGSFRRIAGLAAPLVLSNVVLLGAQVAVTGVIGRMGDAALYIRSVYAPVALLLLAVTTGLSVTVQVVVARCVGRGDERSVGANLGSAARIGVLLALLVGGVIVGLSGVLAALVEVPPEHAGTFRAFLAAMAAANVLGILGELTAAVLRGTGLGLPSALLTGCYVTLNLSIVIVFSGAGLMIVPVASALAGAVELTAGILLLGARGIRPTGRRPDVLRLLGPVGVPVGASFFLLFAVNLLLLRIVAPAGETAVAGFSIAYTVQTFVIVPAVGFGSATAVLMNQRLAAGQEAMTVLRRGTLVVAGCYACVTLAVVGFGRPLMGLLSPNRDIVEHATRFITVVGPTFGATALMIALVTVLEQIGHGPAAVALNVSYFAVMIAVGEWVVTGTDVHPLYVTMAVAALASLVTGLPIAWSLAVRKARQP
ncbi:MATE family efflux transporter [Actinophytocola oryzae]|uniref:Probable multidrug resistance protein NorM n=1 Tax=Actinophytocola oryzae TaxID=502181 RepID=A0A4R7VYJ8_9PSEU|nr:MATE family efflux transporter [Actinophytocola oryzae]TDV54815.1 Na+-driven multidrug efflux pump [Actinophytocola oryzae]